MLKTNRITLFNPGKEAIKCVCAANTRESYYLAVWRQDVDRLIKQDLEQNKPLRNNVYVLFFFYIDSKQKHGVNQSHSFFCLFVFCKQHCNHLIKCFFLLLSTRDMSPSPTALCPWWICGDLFCFLHEINDRLFYQAADIFRRKHSFYFLDGTVLSKSRPQVYHVF